ncbi:phage tail tape measure protein [Paenibacillus sp. YIM B09110]|uniref:phage tail tape measure protein n=1 Tax=Paenibacillus sp. YIM B09110 TaxID=3126102 RepID=UPI00301C73ED
MAFDLVAHLKLIDNMSRPLRNATSSLVGFGAKMTGVGAAMAALTAGMTGVAVATSSIKKAMSFESQMSTIAALTGATADEMAKMQTLALKMGASTKYNALEAAQGIEELLKAGLTPAAVQAGGLEAALNLATAGGLELAAAAEIMSTALNAYKKDGISAAQASNILAGTANASATGVEDLRYALASVSAVAAGVGVTFEDTNIALGLFANNGIKGSDAGTSLKTMLSNLQPTTKDQIKLFRKLGLMTADGSNAFYDAAGNIKSMEDIAGTLQKSLKHLTNEQRSFTLEMIFGSDAVRAGNIMYLEGAEGVKEFRKEMSKVTALDVAKKKMDNAAGAVEQFKGAIETLQISALLPTMPIIKDFATAAANMVEKYSPQIEATMKKSMDKLRTFINTNYLENDEFMALNFADKVKVVAADIKSVFDSWWSSGGEKTFIAISDNITSTLLASLENSVPTITNIGLDLGRGLMSGVIDGMRESKSLGWIFDVQEIMSGKGTKEFWSSIGIDIGKKDDPNAPQERPTTFAGAPNGGYVDFNRLPKKSGGISRVPKTMPAMLHRDETVLPRGEARQYRNSGGASGGVNVSGNTFIVREESDINRIADELYRLINGADNAMGGAY